MKAVDRKTGSKEDSKPKAKVSKYSYLMMLGHAMADVPQGSLSAVLPFLIAEHHYSYAAAAGLVLVSNLLSAVTQPIFGWLGDRDERPWFIIAGMMLAAAGITLVGFFDNYVACCVAVVTIGIGVSLFHPEGSKLANIASSDTNKGTAMGIFAVGGNVGFTGGPILATVAILAFGLKGTAVFMVPAIVASALFVPHLGDLKRIGREYKTQLREDTKSGEMPPDNVKGFAAVAIVVFFRSVIMISLNTFIPLYWIGVFMSSMAAGNIQLSIFAAVGIVATLVGGRLADVIGFRLLFRICTIALPPFLFLFAFCRTPASGTVLILIVSVLVFMCHSAFTITGQSFMPNHMGMASGVLFGLTVSIGGFFAPLIGRIGDVYGLEQAMLAVACFSIGSLVAVFFIPKPQIGPKG